jgi:hypothetical protein
MISSFDDSKIEEILARLDMLERRLNTMEDKVYQMDFTSIVSAVEDVCDIKEKMRNIGNILY